MATALSCSVLHEASEGEKIPSFLRGLDGVLPSGDTVQVTVVVTLLTIENSIIS